MRQFENQANGYVETFDRGGAVAGLLLFGPFYLAVKGLWGHFVFYLGIMLFVATSGSVPIILLAHLILFLGYAFTIDYLVATRFYRRGWVELVHDPEGAAEEELASETRKCPYCAEEIKSEAIKCKHCLSEVLPLHHS
ncbi:zinc ribbon domain-containing protein [Herbaspirillum sp. RU 5E]|nr:zinc ribbon domain-containing protein [Herbaspirillum sp. RU 5E]